MVVEKSLESRGGIKGLGRGSRQGGRRKVEEEQRLDRGLAVEGSVERGAEMRKME